MSDARIICHTDLLEINRLSAKILEHSDPFAKQYGYQVYFDLVEPSSFDELLPF
jgi:hypothetical protein